MFNLILLVAQLSGPFLQAMSGISAETNTVNTKMLLLSISIIIISFIFMKLPRIGHFSILFTIVFGWLLFYFLDLTTPILRAENIFKLPQIFAFGTPQIELNMVVMVFVITLLLLTNMLASVKVMEQLFSRKNIPHESNRLRQTGIISGVNQLLGGIFSTIGAVPISASAGFISTTKITSRRPFVLGSVLIIAISLFPPFTSFFAALPVAVGYAAIFPVFASLIGLAFQGFASVKNKNKMYQIAGISLFAGLGVMFIPPEAFSNMSPTVASVISNGLVLGSLIAIIVEVLLEKITR